MKKINKYLLIAITVLIPLNLGIVNIHAQTKHINRINKSIHIKSSTTRIAKQDAKNDYYKVMNNSKNFDFIYAHPYFYHNLKFLKTYDYQLLKLGKKGEKEKNDDGIGLKAVKNFIKYLPEFQHLNRISKLGAIRAIDNDASGNIPRPYCRNVKYARGYIFGVHYYNNANSALNDTDIGLLADANNYKKSNGKVKINKLVNHKEAQIYRKVVGFEDKANTNAWTGSQIKKANKKLNSHCI